MLCSFLHFQFVSFFAGRPIFVSPSSCERQQIQRTNVNTQKRNATTVGVYSGELNALTPLIAATSHSLSGPSFLCLIIQLVVVSIIILNNDIIWKPVNNNQTISCYSIFYSGSTCVRCYYHHVDRWTSACGVLSGHARLYCSALHCVRLRRAQGGIKRRSMPVIPGLFDDRQTWIMPAKFSLACCLTQDLMYPSLAKERTRHKKKRLVQSPNSYFMDVKCVGKGCSSGLYSALCHVLKLVRLSWKQFFRLLQDHHNLQPCPDSCALHWLLVNPLPTSRRKVQTNRR